MQLSRKPGLVLSLFVLLCCALIVTLGVVDVELESGAHFGLGLPAQVPLLFAAVFAAAVGLSWLRCSWVDLERGICNAIQVSIQAILILSLIHI